MRPDDPGFARALDAWITRCPDDELCAPCARCRHESTDLDAAGLCPSCVASDEEEAELAADPDFVTVCDARRDAWIAALEAETATQWAGVVRAGDALDAAAGVAL